MCGSCDPERERDLDLDLDLDVDFDLATIMEASALLADRARRWVL